MLKKTLTLSLALIASSIMAYAHPWCCSYQPANMSGSDCGTFKFGVEWLYWKVNEDGLDFAFEEKNVTTRTLTSADVDIQEMLVQPHFRFDNGYRIGAAYEFPCSAWEVGVIYTHLNSKATVRRSVADTNDNAIVLNQDDFPLFQTLGEIGFLETRGTWDFEVSYLDIDISRTVCLMEHFSLRPHIGFRGYWMDQQLIIDAAGAPPAISFSNPVMHTRFKEKMFGYGIEAGLGMNWNMGCGLSLVGHFGGAVLYSNYRHHERVNAAESFVASFVTNTSAHSCNSHKVGTPMVDYFLGLQYLGCICDVPYGLLIGWEQHIIFDANKLSKASGNLSMQGLTFGLGAAF